MILTAIQEQRRMRALRNVRRFLRDQRMRGRSWRQMALLTGLDHSTLLRVMTGERRPTLETALRIVDGLVK